jgi:hypothetical protein
MDVVVEGVQYTYSERRVHRGFDLLSGHPTDFAGFGSWVSVAGGWAATEDKRDDSMSEVFVDAAETFHRDR